MDISTALAQIAMESQTQGLDFLETLESIDKEGSEVYCERTMIAFRVVLREGAKMFAPA